MTINREPVTSEILPPTVYNLRLEYIRQKLIAIYGGVEPDPSVMNIGIPGADVSHHQGKINIKKMRELGIRFLIIKCTDGNGFYDPNFDDNYDQAAALLMVLGAYHYVRPGTKITSQIKTIEKGLGTREIDIFMLDCEKTDNQSVQAITDNIWGLAAKFKNRAPIQLIYTRASWWNPNVKRSTNWDDIAALHVAHWGVKTPTLPADWSRWTIWQQGIVENQFGVKGGLDYNVWNPAVPFPSKTQPSSSPSASPSPSPEPPKWGEIRLEDPSGEWGNTQWTQLEAE